MSEQCDHHPEGSDRPGDGPPSDTEADPGQPRSANRAGAWFWLFAAYFVLLPLLGLAAALTDMTLDTAISDESKAEAELDATMIWFLIVAVVLWLFALALGSRKLAGKRVWPEQADRILTGEPHLSRWVIGGLFLAPAALVALFTAISDWLAVGRGWNPNASPRLTCLRTHDGDPLACTTIGQLHSKVVHEKLDLIPLVNLNRTLGWSDPIPDPTAWFGWLLIGMKAVLVVGLLWSVKNLIEASRPNSGERS